MGKGEADVVVDCVERLVDDVWLELDTPVAPTPLEFDELTAEDEETALLRTDVVLGEVEALLNKDEEEAPLLVPWTLLTTDDEGVLETKDELSDEDTEDENPLLGNVLLGGEDAGAEGVEETADGLVWKLLDNVLDWLGN